VPSADAGVTRADYFDEALTRSVPGRPLRDLREVVQFDWNSCRRNPRRDRRADAQ
jgi:hypothetical protein